MTTIAPARQNPARRNSGAMILAALAAAAFWAGWATQYLPQTTANAVTGAASVAAPVLLLLGRNQAAFVGLAALLLAFFPVAGAGFNLLTGAPAQQLFGELRQWPVILSAFGATLALSLLAASRIRAAFARAVFVIVLVMSLMVLAGYGGRLDRWVFATPVHLAIAFVGALVFSSQFSAAISGGLRTKDANFIGGMIQLLPLLGFAGTILGIMRALDALPLIFSDDAATDTSALETMLSGLGGAFETTLLGLGAAITASFINLLLSDSEM